jgi:hypothetical protein
MKKKERSRNNEEKRKKELLKKRSVEDRENKNSGIKYCNFKEINWKKKGGTREKTA